MSTPHRNHPLLAVRHLRRGFTLIEVIVVVAIVATLVALLIPAINNARLTAQAVQCSTNQRACLQLFGTYAADYKGWIFPLGRWNTGSGPDVFQYWTQPLVSGNYIDDTRAFLCPSYPPKAYSTGAAHISYGVNIDNDQMQYDTRNTIGHPRMYYTRRVPAPLDSAPFAGPYLNNSRALTFQRFLEPPPLAEAYSVSLRGTGPTFPIFMGDTLNTATTNASGGRQYATFTPQEPSAASSSNGEIHLRHLRTAVVGFFDGHAERLTSQTIRPYGVTVVWTQEETIFTIP